MDLDFRHYFHYVLGLWYCQQRDMSGGELQLCLVVAAACPGLPRIENAW
jgi:hypothetical protein